MLNFVHDGGRIVFGLRLRGPRVAGRHANWLGDLYFGRSFRRRCRRQLLRLNDFADAVRVAHGLNRLRAVRVRDLVFKRRRDVRRARHSVDFGTVAICV